MSQTFESIPALTNVPLDILISIESIVDPQTPEGMPVVIVAQTDPLEISLSPGEYIGFKLVISSKDPSPDVVHVTLVATPVKDALKFALPPTHRPRGPFIASIIDAGLSVILKVSLLPIQPPSSGETTISTFVLVIILLFVIKPGIEFVPVFGVRPIDKAVEGVFAIQVYEAPEIVPLKLNVFNESPAHRVVSLLGFTLGVGLSVIVKDSGVPGQFAKTELTVMFAISGVPLGVVAKKEGIESFPFDPSPMLVLLLVHE